MTIYLSGYTELSPGIRSPRHILLTDLVNYPDTVFYGYWESQITGIRSIRRIAASDLINADNDVWLYGYDELGGIYDDVRLSASVVGKSAFGTYIGQVVTRTQLWNAGGFNSGSTGTMNEMAFWLRDDVTALKFVYTNWYTKTSDGTETPTGGTMTLRAGVWNSSAALINQITGPLLGIGSGNAAWTIASGATGISDWIPVALSAGSKITVRTQQINASGVMYYDQLANAAIGDRITFDSTDKSLSGTVANDIPGYCFGPSLILAATRKKSIIILGDSTANGLKDTVDSSGDVGNLARGIGPANAYLNGGIPSDRASFFKTNNTKRLALLPYFSDCIVGLGKNDNQGTVQADLATIYAAIRTAAPSIRVSASTVTPQTSGANAAADGSDQTVSVDYTSLNTFLKTVPSPLYRCFDIAVPVSLASPITKWKAGYANPGEATFIHENQTANLAIKAALQSTFAAAFV